MQQQEVVALITTDFPDAEVLVAGEDCSFSAVVIDPGFEGMGLLQRQKAVLATAQEQITRGELHAMTVKAYTPEQWTKVKTDQADGLTVLAL